MSRKAFGILFGISAALRVLLIWAAPLWYDESFTWVVARLPWARFWAAILGDVHPPLYYLIVRPVALLTSAPWVIRIPSLIFSLVALYMAWRIFELMKIPPIVERAALVLLGILPMQLWFAQEGRMYALLEALVLVALYLGMRRRWALYTLALIALCYAQNYGLFYAAVLSLYLWMRLGDLTRIAQCGAWAFLAWLPWLNVMRSQMTTISDAYWIQVTFTGPGTVLALFQQLTFMSLLPGPLLIPAFVVLFVGLILGTITIIRQRWSVLLLALGPLFFAIVASLVWQPILLYRPLIGTTPFLYVVLCWPLYRAARGVTWISLFDLNLPLRNYLRAFKYPDVLSSRPALYGAIFIAPLLVAGVISVYAYGPALKGTRLTEAVRYIQAHYEPGDLIYYTDDGPMINALPALGDLPQAEMPTCHGIYGSLSAESRKAIGIPELAISEISARRIWVLAPASALHPDCYLTQIAPLTVGPPVIQIDNNEFIHSGLWLVYR